MKRDGNPEPAAATARRPRFALIVLAASLALASCQQPAPPAVVRLDTPTLDLDGFTQARVQVTAPGSWTLEAITAPGLGFAVTTSPSSGSGPRQVTVAVDPTAMPRLEDSTFRLRLTAVDGGKELVRTSGDFTFSYPEVTGRVTGGPGPTAIGLGLTADEPLSTAASTPSSDPELASAPTTTLIVGLEPTGLVVSEAGAEVGGMAAAELRVSSTLMRLGLAVAADPFAAASLTLVTVPTDRAEAAAEALRATPGVRYVDFPRLLHPASSDPYRGLQWNLDALGVEPLWGVAGGDGVTIAILDQGFLPDHPDLAANVVGTYRASLGGGPMQAPVPVCGSHGTHVAGIAAAVTNNNVGIAGVAPYAKLLLVDLGTPQSTDCPMTSAALIKALEYVVGDGAPRAQVINMSLGADGDLGPGVRSAVRAAADAGIVLIASAGNDVAPCPAATTKAIAFPAAYPEVLAVAATTPAGDRACYSQSGPQMFVAAPGGALSPTQDEVLSAVVTFPGAAPDYGYMAGTSMASPAVAGVVAMLLSADPTATPARLRDAIATTATDLGAPGHDPEYGYGLIDAAGAYDALLGQPPTPPTPIEGLILRVPGYPDSALDPDGLFTLLNAAPGPLTVEAGTDDNGNGILGEPGEWYGRATVVVSFGAFGPNPGNHLTISVAQVP